MYLRLKVIEANFRKLSMLNLNWLIWTYFNNSKFHLYYLFNSSKYNFLCSICSTLSTFKLLKQTSIFEYFLVHHYNYNQGQNTFAEKVCLHITDPYQKAFKKTLPNLPEVNFDVCLIEFSNDSSATPAINIDFWKVGAK